MTISIQNGDIFANAEQGWYRWYDYSEIIKFSLRTHIFQRKKLQ